jgi:hypothetical protein
MTQTVVVENDATVVIQTEKHNTVVVRTETPKTIVTGMMGPPGKSTMAGLEDVDMSTLTAGSILIYNTQTERWTSTTLLNQQVVDSGQY